MRPIPYVPTGDEAEVDRLTAALAGMESRALAAESAMARVRALVEDPSVIASRILRGKIRAALDGSKP